MTPQESVQKAQEVLLLDRWDCKHTKAHDKTFRCPACQGIMRRCCQSVLSVLHEESCPHT